MHQKTICSTVVGQSITDILARNYPTICTQYHTMTRKNRRFAPHVLSRIIDWKGTIPLPWKGTIPLPSTDLQTSKIMPYMLLSLLFSSPFFRL